jgi:hypothetical protein
MNSGGDHYPVIVVVSAVTLLLVSVFVFIITEIRANESFIPWTRLRKRMIFPMLLIVISTTATDASVS